jgi:hypothetical protein
MDSSKNYSGEDGDNQNLESLQILNSALIKSKGHIVQGQFEDRLNHISKSPAMAAIHKAVSILAESEKITRDESATQIIETFRQLDKIWDEYLMMEGLDQLKGLLSHR